MEPSALMMARKSITASNISSLGRALGMGEDEASPGLTGFLGYGRLGRADVVVKVFCPLMTLMTCQLSM